MEIGDKVIVVNNQHTYLHYEQFILNFHKGYLRWWNDGTYPQEGKEYIVVEKSPHLTEPRKIVYVIDDGSRVFMVGKDAIKVIVRKVSPEEFFEAITET